MKRVRLLGIIAGLLGVVMVGVYSGIIVAEGDDTAAQVAPWFLLMSGASVAALVGSVTSRRSLATWLLAGAAFVFGGVGFLALFSIGLPLLGAAVLAGLAAAQNTEDARRVTIR